MNQLQTPQLASQHIHQLQQDADRARLADQLPAHRRWRLPADPGFTIAGASTAIRDRFGRAQPGAANNCVTR